MKTNRRGLTLLAVLLVIAALVYVFKNQRNNAGSYEAPQQARVESSAGETARNTDDSGDHSNVLMGDVTIRPDLR